MRLFAALGALDCPDCGDRVERALEKVEGVRWARVHRPTSTLAVHYEAGSVEEADLRALVEDAGPIWLAHFPNRGAAERAALAALEGVERELGFKLAGALGAAFLVWTGGWLDLSPYFLMGISAVLLLVCGSPLQAALRHALRHRRMDAASCAALGAWGAFLTTALYAVSGGERGSELSGWLALSSAVCAVGALARARSSRREAQAAELLTRSMPRTVRVLRGGSETRLPATELKPGERVVVLPGEPIGVDGEVAEGSSVVDESFLLGEGALVRKSKGCRVLAGTHNKDSRLELNADRWGDASFLGALIESIRDGQSSRSTPVPFADQVCRWAGPVALLLASGAWAWARHEQAARPIAAGLGLLACVLPPGLLLAGPVAVVLLGRGGGVNFSDEAAAERASEVELVVLGKTGLLSRSKPEIWAVHAAAGVPEEEVLRLALLAGGVPVHPYAEAVRRYAGSLGRGSAASVTAGLDYYPGRGVRSVLPDGEVWVGSPGWLRSRGIECDPGLEAASLWVVKGRTVVGAFDLSDGLKGGARESVKAVQDLGLEVLMVSGDAEPKVRAAAEALGIESYESGVAPSEQLSLVAGLQARGKRVAAVGQGLMEAPILAQADLGIALGDGATADIVLKRDDAYALPSAVRSARRVRLGVRLNVLLVVLPHLAAAAWSAWGGSANAAAEWACLGGLASSAACGLALRSKAA